jgi:hypothetical protein
VLFRSLRASSAAFHEKLGLVEAEAGRIRLYGGANTIPLLDLFIGHPDVSGRERYLRKNNSAEVRSGQGSFSDYVSARRQSWYELRLFQAAPDGGRQEGLAVDRIQRIELSYPPDSEKAAMILARDNGSWTLDGGRQGLESSRIDSYARTLAGVEADDFIPSVGASSPVFTQGSISMELGDGTRLVLSLGPQLEDGRRMAVVSGSSYVYALAEWTVGRLFRDREEFIQLTDK